MVESRINEPDDYAFPWLAEEEWDKAIGQFNIRVGYILSRLFDMYGLGQNIPAAVILIERAAKDLTMRVRGEDRAIAPDINVPGIKEED